ncbi:MAG: phytoene/squalene synthase family protein [Actinomycetales bacterium]
MSSRDLDAAGIRDPRMRASYERCRRLNAAHGKTYYLATLLLPPAKRPYVHALYGFARYADEIVDDLDSTLSDEQKADWLGSWGDQFLADLAEGSSRDEVCMAVVDTVRTWDIPTEHFTAFLHSMRMDLTVTEYPTYQDLYEYVYGSAAVIGLQMVPILEPTAQVAYDRAMELGIAFQLANFIRDVGEDLDRGRVYLPLQELAEHGVTRADLERRVATPEIKQALRFQVSRVRELQDRSRDGVEMLHPSSRACIEAASTLYCGIVDQVEAIDYEVFRQRAKVPTSRRLAVAVPAWRRARQARRAYGSGFVRTT